VPGWADNLTDVMTWPRQRTAVPTGTCRLLGACVQPFHDPIRGYGVRVLLRWYRIELFRSSILYRQRRDAHAESESGRARDKNGIDIFRPYLRSNLFRGVLIHLYLSPNI
jgi:hypothetical protein